jgi:fatty aldehyde-generating acyl-ACP reductase
MDRMSAGLDFAVIGHQDNWQHISSLINGIRTGQLEQLNADVIRNIYSFIPPRDIFRIQAHSTTGRKINGVYIETFIDPDKLDPGHRCENICKVKKAISFVNKLGAKIVTLGGFSSIVLEGNLQGLQEGETVYTTGNTLTSAYVVKGIEKAAAICGKDIRESNLLIIGATGDIGMACVQYFKNKTKKLLLCGRNIQRLKQLALSLKDAYVPHHYSVHLEDLVPEADIIISAASSAGIQLTNYKKGVIIGDAGFPKNLESSTGCNQDLHLFYAGMGQISGGYSFSPDYSHYMYRHASPYISHGCVIEAMVLAFENKYQSYSAGRGNIGICCMEEIYALALKHGIGLAPFFNSNGLW